MGQIDSLDVVCLLLGLAIAYVAMAPLSRSRSGDEPAYWRAFVVVGAGLLIGYFISVLAQAFRHVPR